MFCKDNKGYSKTTNILLIFLCCVILFFAYNVLPFYYYYFELKNQMNLILEKSRQDNDAKIKEKLFDVIKGLKIPANKDDIKIEREENKIKISLSYQEVFFITINGKDYDILPLDFNASAQRDDT